MNPLHEYVAKQLAEKLKKRGVVVWYDPRAEFAKWNTESIAIALAAFGVMPAGIEAVFERLEIAFHHGRVNRGHDGFVAALEAQWDLATQRRRTSK